MNRGTGLVTLVLGTLGCASAHTPAVWVGAEFAQLRQAFGEPAGILINERNNRIYAFRFNADPAAKTPEHADDSAPTPLAYGDATLPMSATDCVVLFELAGPGVVAWDWQGDGCGQRPVPLPYQFPAAP